MDTIKEKIKLLFNTGLFHIFGSSVINKIIAFMSSIILVRILTKEEYGVFTYSWNIYCILALFCGLGYESGVLQLASERSTDLDYVRSISNYGMKNGMWFNCILMVVILAIGLFAPLTIKGSETLICSMCLLPFAQFMFNMCSTSLRVQKKNREYSILNVVNTVCVFVGSCLFAYLLREIGLVWGHYLAYIVACVFAFIYFRIKPFSKCEPLPKTEKRTVTKISIISMVNIALSQLLYLIDIFVLGVVNQQETVLASYKVATMIPTALSFIPVSVITYVYPYFAEHKDDGKWCDYHYRQLVMCLGGFNLLLSIFLYVLAPYIISLLFGNQYIDAVPVFRILIISYFLSGTFRTISGNLLVTQRKLLFNLFVAIFSSSINIILDYFLVRKIGVNGAAYATLFVVVITSILNTTYLLKTFRNKTGKEDSNM